MGFVHLGVCTSSARGGGGGSLQRAPIFFLGGRFKKDLQAENLPRKKKQSFSVHLCRIACAFWLFRLFLAFNFSFPTDENRRDITITLLFRNMNTLFGHRVACSAYPIK